LSIEAISRFDPSVAVVAVASNLAAAILAKHATADQRERFVKPIARGEKGAVSFALTEPGAGSDAAGIKTRAVRDGDGWVLDGSKQWITGGSHAQVFTVFAKTPGEGGGDDAVTCFAVEKGTDGFSLGRLEDKMGLRSSGTAQLFFESCRVPDANVIGEPGQGLRIALGAIAPSRVAIAAQSIGIAERAFQLGLEYAGERKAFGKSVSSFQNSRFVLADCRTELDQAWLLDVARRLAAGSGRADPLGSLDGQARGVGNLRPGGRPDAAVARRQWLFARIRDRAALPRCPRDAHLSKAPAKSSAR
jgi:butyryl-CoA dehydrogenase